MRQPPDHCSQIALERQTWAPFRTGPVAPGRPAGPQTQAFRHDLPSCSATAYQVLALLVSTQTVRHALAPLAHCLCCPRMPESWSGVALCSGSHPPEKHSVTRGGVSEPESASALSSCVRETERSWKVGAGK